jgi:hypothetical protein
MITRSRRFLPAIAALVLGCVAGCQSKSAATLEGAAEHYVTLALELGRERPKEIDAYFGPPALDPREKGKAAGLAALLERARQLQGDVGQAAGEDASRRAHLSASVSQLVKVLESLTATARPAFDAEAKTLYGLELAPPDDAALKGRLQQLDELLPGPGSLAFRVASYRNRFIIPGGKREAVFERALAECRRRTLEHWPLPGSEQLKVEWSRDVDAAWYRYEGEGKGRVQVNPAAIAYTGSPLDMACHEGYPGHHAQFLLMDDAAKGTLSVEDTVVLLRSPASVLREGAAAYAVELAFPPDERLAFERDVLFPLAGLPPAEAEKYLKVHRLVNELAEAVTPVLRDYRDGTISFNSATFKLEADALISSPSALLKFTDELGAYVAAYSTVTGRVRSQVESGGAAPESDRWMRLRELLQSQDITRLAPNPTSAP